MAARSGARSQPAGKDARKDAPRGATNEQLFRGVFLSAPMKRVLSARAEDARTGNFADGRI